MLTSKHFKNHRGQSHKTNIAFVALAALCAVGTIVALSAPLWRPSTAAFATTPEAFILAGVNIALVGLAVYAISKNNEISELKAPKIVVDGEAKLLVTKEVYEEMKKDNQVKDNAEEDKWYIDFSLKGENYRITVDGQFDNDETIGNTLLLSINSLEVKNKEGKFEAIEEEWDKTLGLDKDGAKEVNTYLGQLISVEQVASQQQGK
ncbi:hypothetical protein [Wolbachia endosymbiont (group A) of Anomoia purmunda]|uniref:hypothetical protein n=1 Tax=Wolbachia endosymbiont (group A) of Anomoia purmunda TaxID=2953978 RepID=UPI00222EB514|nr:hypothetical protein [Wolbachia endosymbiont (group A) of Anomoia purmunda]